MVRKQLENWQKEKMTCHANSSSCWKNILGWLGWSSSSSLTMLYHGHRVDTSPNKMANIRNNFYVNKMASIHAALTLPSKDPLALLPKHPDTIHWIIENLKKIKSVRLK